eukprot:143687_1
MAVNKKTHEIIELLTRYGVSSRFGHFNVSALTSTKPRVATIKEARSANDSMSSLKKMKKKRKYRISDRLAYDEVYDTIDSHLHLTFDYLALIFVGGVISAIGLLTNSAVAVVASMLVSPLMGPIVGMTFGAIIKDKVMLWKSFRNELIGVAVCFFTGAFMGFITAPFLNNAEDPELAFGQNTQISSRGEWEALAWGAGIAATSGIGVALGVSSDQVSALIGVAISAALLPPVTNSGICLASAFVFFINPKYPNHVVDKWFDVGCISMVLFILNWILIFIFGSLTFRAKNLHQSANEHLKLQRLNQFYEMREQINEENETVGNILGSLTTSLMNTTSAEQKDLKVPLLASSNNYTHQKNAATIQINASLNKNNEIEFMDGVPNMLAQLSDNVDMNKDTGEMMNWDGKTGRNQRGMSAVTENEYNFSQKRKIKKSASEFDASHIINVSMKSTSKNTKGSDDIF